MLQKVIIVIPTYKEVKNIAKIIKAITSLNLNIEILVVDDNSPDGTAAEVKKIMTTRPVFLLERPKKMGIGSAYIAGFYFALKKGADLIFEMDADFSHDPAEIPNFIKEINNGFDIVIGSRRVIGGNVEGWNFIRNLMSKSAVWFARKVLGLKTFDATSGFRCYRREVLEHIDLEKIKSNGYAFQEEMIYWCERLNFKIKEIPIVFIERTAGKSKMTIKEIFLFFITIIRLKISA